MTIRIYHVNTYSIIEGISAVSRVAMSHRLNVKISYFLLKHI